MAEPAWNADKGMTLTEVLVALAIVFIVFLGLTESGLVALEYNIQNLLREEGVRVTDAWIADSRSIPFATLNGMIAANPTVEPPVDINRRVRNLNWPYRITRTLTRLNPDNIQISIDVTWTRSGRTFFHQATAIVRSP
ncbi:MAG: prepilin-type N-terminal cleavage/methylation domain-containing protein [Deltaproteobacteria bacterium]|nr:prepilin-type N-terminal cleavage/methylation domain-containing protein [Deltaproteobacteria bacterium]